MQYVWLSMNIMPILHTIQYTIVMNFSKHRGVICDAKRLPWSYGIKMLYFPSQTISLDASFQTLSTLTSTHPDAKKWLNFDVTFHMQRLIPNINVEVYYELFKTKNFSKMVYDIGGVDSSVLARFLVNDGGDSHELVYDANVIAELTTRMKLCKKVWMNDVDLCGFLVKDRKLSACVERLVERGVIMFNSDFDIAFAWAVCRLEKAVAMNIRVKHEQNALPVEVSQSMMNNTVCVDWDFAIDKWIDMRMFPVTLLMSPIAEEDSFVIPQIRKFETIKDATEKVQNELKQLGRDLKVMCVSTLGTLSFDNLMTTTCVTVSAINTRRTDVTFIRKNAVILVKKNVMHPDSSLVYLEKNTQPIIVNDDDLFPYIKPMASCTFENVLNVGKKLNFDRIVVVYDKSVHKRFHKELSRFPAEIIIAVMI